MEKKPLIILIIGVSAYLAYIFLYVGIDRLTSVLAGTNPLLIVLSMLLLLLSIVLHGLSWHILISGGGASTPKTISTMAVSLFASYVAPIGAASEFVRFYIATRIVGLSAATTVLSILVHRVCITLAPLITLASLILYLGGDLVVVERAAITTIVAMYISLIVLPNILAIGLIRTKIFENLVKRYEKHLSRIIGSDVINFSEEYRRSIADIIGGRRFPIALFISLIEWFFLAASMYMIFMALSLKKDLVIAAASIILIQILWWILPISFAGSIGITDLLASIAYQLLNFEPGASASIVLLYRLTSLTSLLILFYPSLKILSLYPGEFRSIYKGRGEDKKIAKDPQEPPKNS